MNIKEATGKWVDSFNSIPLSLIERAYKDNVDDLQELTPLKYICPECDKEYTEDEAEEQDYYCNCQKLLTYEEWAEQEGYYNLRNLSEDEQVKIFLKYREYVEYFEQPCLEELYPDSWLPMWGWVWTFDNSLDEEWAREHINEMAKCGFRIYESDELGIFFGIDGAGYDFYANHWIPLYKARGLKWHDEKSDKVLNNDLIIKANIFKDIIRAEKDQVEPTIQSLLKFKEAYYELLETWYENDILDQTESLKIYPFHISFDELNVAEWVDSTVEEIQKAYKDIKKEEC